MTDPHFTYLSRPHRDLTVTPSFLGDRHTDHLSADGPLAFRSGHGGPPAGHRYNLGCEYDACAWGAA